MKYAKPVTHYIKGPELNRKEVSLYQSLPLTASSLVEADSHVPLPSTEDIERAKNWVDFNEK